MPQLDKNRVKGIIWDLDNTLYRFDEAFEHACNLASARAAIEMGVEMSLDEALVLAQQSFDDHGYSGLIFERQFEICHKEYHFKYHDAIDEKIIQANEEMKKAMAAVDLPHVILTNASRGWAHRVLEHLGLSQWFLDDHIIAQEDTDFTPKARGPKGFELALRKLNVPYENALMVDDLEKNLRIPKEMGLQTALIHHGKKRDQSPAWVDAEFSDTIAFMQFFRPESQDHTPPLPQQASS